MLESLNVGIVALCAKECLGSLVMWSRQIDGELSSIRCAVSTSKGLLN